MEGSPPHRRRRLNDPLNPPANVELTRVKDSLCFFCPLNLDVTNFEAHMQLSDDCRNLYMKLLVVDTIDGIMTKTFDCIFCPARFCKLSDHLRGSPACRDRYFQRMGVDNLK